MQEPQPSAQLQPQQPSQHPPPPPPPPPSAIAGSRRAAAEWATQRKDLGLGWKRTLSPEVHAEATWFDRERTLPQIFEDVRPGEIVWLTFANSALRDLRAL